MKYRIVHRHVGDRWYPIDEELFDTPEEADASIDDLIVSTHLAYELGHMDEPYRREDFKVEAAQDSER